MRVSAPDLLALAALVLALLWAAQPSWKGLRQGEIYVSPQGWDGHLGGTPRTAVRTLQRAVDLATPGETVVILPGTYAESVRIRRGGELGRPVIFRALQPGSVTITGAADPRALQDLEWRDEGGGIRSAVPPWPVHHLRQGESTLFHLVWGGLARLRRLTKLPGAWGAFVYERQANRLFVFLPGEAWSQRPVLTVHRPIPSPREWGNIRSANVWVEADHVVFQGLRFDFGVGAGLLLWNASHVTVRDCSFGGSDIGIGAHPRLGGATQLHVEHSLYQNYPQYHWQHGWLPWHEVYSSYASSSLVAMGGRGVSVAHSLVSNGGDAVRVSPQPGVGQWGAVVHGNLFFRGTDDAVEAEGDVYGVRVYGNIVYDHHQNLGLSPVWKGPVLVEENRFLNPQGGLGFSQVKLLNPEPRPGQPPPPPIQNITLRDNVFVGRWRTWSNAPVHDVEVYNNLFALQRPREAPWPMGVVAQNNTETTLAESGYPNPGSDVLWWKGSIRGGPLRPVRPGPRWLDWDTHPSTREISTLVQLAGWSSAPQSGQ